MPQPIDRAELQRLVADGAQLVEVLPEEEYREEHLPEAISLPLKVLTAEAAAGKVRKGKPVIVYCWDALCDLSPRAARHLERFGYEPVYDYTTGKADWIAAGLPTVGAGSPPRRVTSIMDSMVPTCKPNEPVAEVVDRARAMGWEMAVVVDEHNVVLGRLRLARIDPRSTAPVDAAMEPGPATVHGGATVDETVRRMQDRHVGSLVVSTPDGELLGVVRR